MSTRRTEADLAAQMLRLNERAAPATPPTGTLFAYAKTDGVLYTKNDTGVEIAHDGDPWTYLKLAADFSNSTLTATDVTGLALTPVANTDYLVRAYLPTVAAAVTTGVQLGLGGPTGMNYAAVKIRQPTTATTDVTLNGGLNSFCAATAGLTTVALSEIEALVSVGPAISGTIRVQLKSEVAGSAVTVKAGAVMLYREV